jgi:5-formyltetrahydrofolate cyclo-ligase
MDLALPKQALRTATIARVLALDPTRRAAQQESLEERFATLPGFEGATTVLLYASAFPEEIETGPMLRRSWDAGKRVLLPRVDRGEKRLRLYHVADPVADLRRGTMGIPEPRRRCREAYPAEVDWALVPGIAFDDRCYRLGRGAGHYDRLLPTLRPDAPRWALAFDEQWVDDLPFEPHDVPVDGVVSPSRTVRRDEPLSRP